MKTYWRSAFIYALASLYLFYIMGIQVSPSVMSVQLTEAMQISAAGFGLMSAFYFYSYTLIQIPGGFFMDRFGIHYYVSGSILVCALGTLLLGLANSLWLGAFARLLTGLGSACAFVSVLVVAEKWFPKRYFPILAGMAQLYAALGAISGELPLVITVEKIGWQTTLFVLAAIGIALSAFLFISTRNEGHRSGDHKKIDMVGNIKTLLRTKQTWWVAIYAFFNWAPMATFASLWGIPFLEKAFNCSPHLAASLMSLTWIGIGVGSPLIGILSNQIKRRVPLLTISAALGAVATAILLYANIDTQWPLWLSLFIMGLACSGQVLSFSVVKDNAPEGIRATAISINNMAVVAAGALLQPLVGILLKAHNPQVDGIGLDMYTSNDFSFALSVVLISFIAGALISHYKIKENFPLMQAEEEQNMAAQESL